MYISQDQRINASVLRAVSGAPAWPQVAIGGKPAGSAGEVEAGPDAGRKAG